MKETIALTSKWCQCFAILALGWDNVLYADFCVVQNPIDHSAVFSSIQWFLHQLHRLPGHLQTFVVVLLILSIAPPFANSPCLDPILVSIQIALDNFAGKKTNKQNGNYCLFGILEFWWDIFLWRESLNCQSLNNIEYWKFQLMRYCICNLMNESTVINNHSNFKSPFSSDADWWTWTTDANASIELGQVKQKLDWLIEINTVCC